MKKVLSFILAFAMILSVASCGASGGGKDRLARIKEKGYLEMITEPYWAPNEFIDPTKTGDEQYVGLDIELGKYIAEKIGVTLKVIPLEFTAVQTGITEAKYDMAISALAWSPSRDENMYLSDGYEYDSTAGYGFLVRAEDKDKYTSIDSLKDAVVITQSGAVQEGIYNEYCNNAKEFKRVSSMTDAYLAVKENKADVCITALSSAELFVEANPGYAVPDFVFDTDKKYSSTVVAIPKGAENDSLMKIINQCIKELTEQKKFDEWSEYYKDYAKSLGLE